MKIPKHIGGIEFYRAPRNYEDYVYDVVKSGVFEEFAPKIYTDKKEVTSIVNLKFGIYNEILDEYLPRIDPHEFVPFLVQQYERYGKISDLHKLGKLTSEEDEFWAAYAMNARRGMKHLLERLCISGMSKEGVRESIQEQWDAIAMVFIAAEELVSLYMRSDHYTHMFDEVTLTLNQEKDPYFDVKEDSLTRFDPREGYRDSQNCIPSPDILFDIQTHDKIIGDGFKEKLGVTYQDAIAILRSTIENCSYCDEPDAVGLIHRPTWVNEISRDCSISSEQAGLILDGFTLTAKDMRSEGRRLIRPKQEYRAYKRGFFMDPNSRNELLFFSRRMADECLSLLISGVAFKKLPPEWRSAKLNLDLSALSLKAGKWFEQVVKDNLNSVGVVGVASLKMIRLKSGQRIEVPKNVGEIDFIGYCLRQKMLVVIEAKQVGIATESRMYLDDYSKFVADKNNYSEKFSKKCSWVRDNLPLVEKYVRENFSPEAEIRSIGYAMITRYPIYVAKKISEFTCISLPEFMSSYNASDRVWGFSKIDLVCAESAHP